MNKLNNKGFTITELLGALVILGVILAVATPAYFAISNGIKEGQYENTIDLIKVGAEKYASDNFVKGTKCIQISKLIEYGYVSADNDAGELFNPKEPNETLNQLYADITSSSGNYTVEIKETC